MSGQFPPQPFGRPQQGGNPQFAQQSHLPQYGQPQGYQPQAPQQYFQQNAQQTYQPQQGNYQPPQFQNQQPSMPPRPEFQSEYKPNKANGSNNTHDYGSSAGFPNDTQASASRFVGLRKFKDLWAAVLFLLFLAGFVVCVIFGITAFKENSAAGSPTNLPFLPGDYAVVFGGSVLVGFLLSLAYFFAMKRYTRKLIVASFIFQIALNVALGLFLIFFARSYITGAVLLIIAAISAFLFYNWRSRFPFAQVMLETVLAVIGKYPSTITTGIIGLFVQMAFTVVWMIALIGVSLKIAAQNQASNGGKSGPPANPGYYVLIAFIVFTFYWVTQVIKNVVHVTVSGVFATYYFFGISDGQGRITVAVANPTSASAKRALTTSFGSICFGSLIIAIIQMIKAIAQQAANQNSNEGNMAAAFCLICVTCLLGCLEGIMEYFNHVAIYGKDFCEAAKSTWRLIKHRGIDAIINDSLIGNVLGLGTFIVGLIGAAFGASVVAISTSIPDTTSNYLIVCFVCFAVCAAEFAIIAEVINSGVATTFVCLAEEPQALQRTKPELYNQVRQTYPQVGI